MKFYSVYFADYGGYVAFFRDRDDLLFFIQDIDLEFYGPVTIEYKDIKEIEINEISDLCDS